MHCYRTHNCNELRPENVGETARLSGWIHRRRDHGQLVFLDLRDHFGITQCVVDIEDKSFSDVEKVRVESVTGKNAFLMLETYVGESPEFTQQQSAYADNLNLNTEAGYTTASLTDDILDFTERNPFGEVDE